MYRLRSQGNLWQNLWHKQNGAFSTVFALNPPPDPCVQPHFFWRSTISRRACSWISSCSFLGYSIREAECCGMRFLVGRVGGGTFNHELKQHVLLPVARKSQHCSQLPQPLRTCLIAHEILTGSNASHAHLSNWQPSCRYSVFFLISTKDPGCLSC